MIRVVTEWRVQYDSIKERKKINQNNRNNQFRMN